MDGKGLQLNERALPGCEKEIAAKQAELLRLQQSVQAESQAAREVDARRPPAVKPVRREANRAYDLDREARQPVPREEVRRGAEEIAAKQSS